MPQDNIDELKAKNKWLRECLERSAQKRERYKALANKFDKLKAKILLNKLKKGT